MLIYIEKLNIQKYQIVFFIIQMISSLTIS